MITALLILHGLFAVALLGGITHQTISVFFSSRKGSSFPAKLTSVTAAVYTRAVIVLYLITFVLGGVIYPAYRVAVRTWLETARLWAFSGSFEVKEQIVTIGLGMLPFYWHIWRQPLDKQYSTARKLTTFMLCLIIWSGFLVGHVLNNIRGLFGQ